MNTVGTNVVARPVHDLDSVRVTARGQRSADCVSRAREHGARWRQRSRRVHQTPPRVEGRSGPGLFDHANADDLMVGDMETEKIGIHWILDIAENRCVTGKRDLIANAAGRKSLKVYAVSTRVVPGIVLNFDQAWAARA